MFEAGDVELYFAVEGLAIVLIKIVSLAIAVLLQRREDVGIQPSDEIQHGRFDVVHVRGGVEAETILFRCSLLKLLEGVQYIRTVVEFESYRLTVMRLPVM